MNGFDVFKTYQAIKLHFGTPTYNFFVYNGKTNATLDSFERRRDKFMFHKLARKYKEEEIVPFLVANFVHNNHTWTKDLLSDEAREVYTNWIKINQSMSQIFKDDLARLMPNERSPKEFNKLFVTDGDYPKILTAYQVNDITLETLTVLNSMMNFITIWDKKIEDDIIYPKVSLKVRKYGAFLNVDVKKYKNILLSVLEAI
jgi:hypothetical protein